MCDLNSPNSQTAQDKKAYAYVAYYSDDKCTQLEGFLGFASGETLELLINDKRGNIVRRCDGVYSAAWGGSGKALNLTDEANYW